MRLPALLSARNFPKFAVATVAASGVVGWACLSLVKRSNPDVSDDNNSCHHRNANHKGEISRDETLVRAMIQNAKESSWRENLGNAVMAQERFVLPERHPARRSSTDTSNGGGCQDQGEGQRDAFVRKIVQLSDKMLEQQKMDREQRRKMEEENRTEKFTTWSDR